MGSVATRLGLELIRPKSIVEHEAKNPAGTVLYSVDSEILGINPILTFEWSFIKSKESKVYAFAGGGLSVTRMQNTFTMTADGISELGVSSDFIEKGVANDVAGHIGFGFEILMVDNVTFMSEVGYRSLIARTFKSSTTTTSFVGAIAEGDVLKNHDGKDRSVDLSGPFVGIGFRFYL